MEQLTQSITLQRLTNRVILIFTAHTFQTEGRLTLSRTAHHEPGLKLKRVRERLNLRYRDVEVASQTIASERGNDEYIINLSRLSDIENKGTVPTIFRLYSLCAIYRLDPLEVLGWYGVKFEQQPADAASVDIEVSHLIRFSANLPGEVQVPLTLDPGFDPKRTNYLSRMIQQWGKLPLALLNHLDIRNHRYGFIGTDDWSMYPLVQPGSFVLIDESRRKIINSGWSNEFERPIYFLEHRKGFAYGWCTLNESSLMVQPHPASMCAPEIFKYPAEVEIVGQITGVAMRLDPERRRRTRA